MYIYQTRFYILESKATFLGKQTYGFTPGLMSANFMNSVVTKKDIKKLTNKGLISEPASRKA